MKTLTNGMRALFSVLIILINTIVGSTSLAVTALLRLIMPFKRLRKWCFDLMVTIAENWSAINNWVIDHLSQIKIKIEGTEYLSRNESFLIIANHQSWLDIPMIQYAFNRRVPFIRFFIKSELIFVPFLNLAWVALGFPFMKRHSKKFLEAHPERRFDDLKSIKKACAHVVGEKVSFLTFGEGTRFTLAKKERQGSPFKNLLIPRAGGFAYILNSIQEPFSAVLDVTIFYPHGTVSLFGALMGKLPEVIVKIERMLVPSAVAKGDYTQDPAYRETVQNWLRELWQKKDDVLIQLSQNELSRI